MSDQEKRQVAVWDPFVRIFHWLLVAAFIIAYLTEGENMDLHAPAGYTVGILVLLRVIWGFVGPRHARFSDFTYSPRAIITYLAGLLTFRGTRYVGHSPAGGAMVIALLLSLAITVSAGLIVYGGEKGAGPLAGFFTTQTTDVPVSETPFYSDETGEYGERSEDAESPIVETAEEVHEVFANLTLVLVILHILAVFWASLVHRENLPRAMITGRKRE
jgi:cytochrome b